MQAKNISFHELLIKLRSYFQENNQSRKYANEQPPLRAELFSTAQMEQYGRHLAKAHKTVTGRAPNFLLKRLAENEDMLHEVRNLLAEAIKEEQMISPAGEWLLDNFYLVEEHIRTGKQHLPKGYSEGLPRLTEGDKEGLPRVYDIAVEIIAHSDGHIDIQNISSFLHAYQQVTTLKMGELWAIPIMLRLALIENLRRVSARIAIDRINQKLADQWSDLMMETAEKDPKSLILVIADMARSGPPMEGSFVAELTRQLMWKGPALTLPLTWMEQRLAENGLTTARLVDMENQKQAADQVSISNTIGSLRFVNTMDWREFVETMSSVESTLRHDPAGVYGQMDFATRDKYRHIVEQVSKFSQCSETKVAELVLELANSGNVLYGSANKKSHVGYYLAEKGLRETEKAAKMRLPLHHAAFKLLKDNRLMVYASSITFITILLAGLAAYRVYLHNSPIWLTVIVAVFSMIAASQLALALVNWVATLRIVPNMLPRLDLSHEIPVEYKTLVVVPTMISSPHGISSLTESLEIRFLANRKPNIYFGLLTDFNDAPKEHMPADDELVAIAGEKIKDLNKKYGGGKDIFFLFHRPRKWNKHDNTWMGYERKRGKLGALNDFLLNGNADEFTSIVGDTTLLHRVKYIITLDTDTLLPRDSAWKLIATMAHPLNHPVYSETKGRVTEGYGLLQPRVCVNMPEPDSSFYSRMHASDTGVDPYTRLTSDVYQDLFYEGSFIGKGIYDIAVFEKALSNRFSENRILSHDLIEGCYIRSGLATDIQVYEDNPGKFSTDVSRRHRWIRGDWQIAWWALPIVPDANRKLKANPLSVLSRWKIFDNLRRSLVPFSIMVLLILGCSLLDDPWYWTLSLFAIIILPSLIGSLWGLMNRPKEIMPSQHIISSLGSMTDGLKQNIFALACLPFEAFYTVDAILRTSWRMIISNRKLLQWKPSGTVEQNNDNTLSNAYRAMWINPVVAIALGIYMGIYEGISLFIMMPILLLWLTAPAVTWLISRKSAKIKTELSAAQLYFLQKLTRKTWAYFKEFVGPEDNWLPPDNYQEVPRGIVAHRTSPTNIGMALLANLSAYDFGYITGGQLMDRCTNTFETMGKLERSRGHFYNWYDTVSLTPLPPRYISAVDSGNLAGHLLTLKQGLTEIPGNQVITRRAFEGLRDTLGVLEEQAGNTKQISEFRDFLVKVISNNQVYLQEVYKDAVTLRQLSGNIIDSFSNPTGDVLWWAEELSQQCTAITTELTTLVPWCDSTKIPEGADMGVIENIPPLKSIHGIAASLANFDRAAIENAIATAEKRLREVDNLIEECEIYADIEFEFLYDRTKHLVAIGYNVEDNKRDESYYDLLASEARLANFVAIAQDKLPQDSWFALGRSVTNTGGGVMLLSWSGSMFEYLMPLLVMPTYGQTLLDQTYRSVIERQIAYGQKRDIPWGISESGYNRVDAAQNYQYKAFGVPGTGLKRGLGDDLVIAPYASVMALMVMPNEACENLQNMATLGFMGKYGFYEAIDYTPGRLPRGQSNAIIRSFMVHHEGMSMLALSYLLQNMPMQKRFESELRFQASLLLLQEKIPKATTSYAHTMDVSDIKITAKDSDMRYINTPNTPVPEIQLLSNGTYNVMVSNSGGGYSRWREIAVSRWREDTTCDNWGTFCYIKDVEQDILWSNTHQPTLTEAKSYEALFTQGRAEFKRFDHHIETHTEVVVSPEDDIELRRIKITNRSRRRRTLEITSYAEVVLNVPAADEIHPAFSNLFVQTELQQEKHAILCSRRPRSADQHPSWMCHLVKLRGIKHESVEYETSRMHFIGRGNTVANPQVVTGNAKMQGNEGSVLDPIVAIKYRITLEPGEIATIDMINGMSPDKEGCQALVDKYQDKHLTDRVLELAWTHSQVVLRQINATESDAQLYGRMASYIIYMNSMLRADTATIISNHKGQPGLWGYAVSGDVPIVLLKVREATSIDMVKQLLQAHAYWRTKGLIVDLVIWNEDHGGYRQTMQDEIQGLISAAGANYTDRQGGIFLRPGDQISKEDRILFETVARIIISDDKGSLSDQLSRRNANKGAVPLLEPPAIREALTSLPLTQPQGLVFYNGTGGFTENGNEYVIITGSKKTTPAPWSNVLANKNFGSIISESGQAYTWIENAHEQRLTPWHNDPVSDLSGEQIYLRDEDTGYVWSPVPLPLHPTSPYITRHGYGYSVFTHSENGIYSELTIFVDIEKTIKFSLLKLRNDSEKTRKISATGYAEWVLGDRRAKTSMHVITEADATTGTLYARNEYSPEFSGKVAFFDTDDGVTRSFTCDRAEFIGRNNSLKAPDAMLRQRLSGKTGAGIDACAAIQITHELITGQEKEIVFRLGAGYNMGDAVNLAKEFKGLSAAYSSLEKVKRYWQQTLDVIKVATPDKALNFLANGWLVYQTIACRLWARSGYYQSGGAYGFRDQLQDVLAVLYTRPDITRAQILASAARQFQEGDVQHWWHPPGGRGVRTTCSDDYLWLPFVTARYIQHTGDLEILDEEIGFLTGRPLNDGEESYYDLPGKSGNTATLYRHCVLAVDHALKFGTHGLPFMGSGDWNDGMDKVGQHGRGESIWLAFFLHDILNSFARVSTQYNDEEQARRYIQQGAQLKTNINNNGWDGGWYRRAYFDDGTPLGSATNEECSIDSISQSWSVLSGAGYVERSAIAMDAVYDRLVDKQNGLIQLLDPPFDKSALDPGYIKGYVPGVRENGGQYSHAAIWTVMAFAAIGDKKRTWELLDMINPINHGSTADEVSTYKVEPYIMAADVYKVPSHLGRGGWTWYTGSAGWMYQCIIQSFLGIRQKGDQLSFAPCLPPDWDDCSIDYKYKDTTYHITIHCKTINALPVVKLDNTNQHGNTITMVNDGKTHEVIVG
ncbi:cyclic beta 1-2 glucan synthetase [Flavipsychrobacter stenotrophus]|uniref:Cyclic beta 1-2 glucan synthetase n=1 Tax=Flavipsychrobacter stenotrophus TaxID=2077091 RepID=A0A2S7SQX1_9BACT|nr:glycoside hydrolase family 94 protein [Flavipsychrobacter stenotrophus]PQJ09144.1 cyclic beta 1-2 glucan synthetase [Flavipsychrobacter stenotrophus]